MATSKWFYQYQDKVEDRLKEKGLTRHGYCNYQDATTDRYYENWDCMNEKGELTNHLIVVHRQTGFMYVYQVIS